MGDTGRQAVSSASTLFRFVQIKADCFETLLIRKIFHIQNVLFKATQFEFKFKYLLIYFKATRT